MPLSGPIVPSFYGAYDMSDIAPWSYDPEKATALLAEAGWTDTNGDGKVQLADIVSGMSGYISVNQTAPVTAVPRARCLARPKRSVTSRR